MKYFNISFISYPFQKAFAARFFIFIIITIIEIASTVFHSTVRWQHVYIVYTKRLQGLKEKAI